MTDAAVAPTRTPSAARLTRPSARSRLVSRVLGGIVLLALIIAMVVSTRFLTPAELAAVGPVRFDPVQTAAALFAKAENELPGAAQDLAVALPAIQADPQAALSKYQGLSPTDNAYVFPVKTTATVASASGSSLRLTVTGLPGQTPVLVPLSTAINGTAVRDMMGFKFASAPGQTDYQYVGDELKKLMQAKVDAAVSDPASAQGKKITIVGVVSIVTTGGAVPKAKPVNIQPVSIQVTS